jgi:hypothetical protein
MAWRRAVHERFEIRFLSVSAGGDPAARPARLTQRKEPSGPPGNGFPGGRINASVARGRDAWQQEGDGEQREQDRWFHGT